MDDHDRRNLLRHDTEIQVSIIAGNSRFSARMINIGISGIGLISETYIKPKTEIDISLDFMKNHTIQGLIRWVNEVNINQHIYYRIGIDVESITFEGNKTTGFPEQKKLAQIVISETMRHSINPDDMALKGAKLLSINQD